MKTAWLILIAAGLLEIGWAVGSKYSQGFTLLIPSLLTLGSMALSIALLGIAARHLPIGTAYATWTGIGAVGVAVFGMLVLGEPVSLARFGCLGLIVGGVAGLRLLQG